MTRLSETSRRLDRAIALALGRHHGPRLWLLNERQLEEYRDWQAARPNIPIEQMEADHWDRLGFNEQHNKSVALFVNAQRQRLTLTGVGLFQCALSLMLLEGMTTFEVESMVERILGKHSENWHDAVDFLDTTVPYIAAQSGKLASPIPGDSSERRAYLSPRHQRLVAPAFWTEMLGPPHTG